MKSIFDSETEMKDSDETLMIGTKTGDSSTKPVVGRAESEKVSLTNEIGNNDIYIYDIYCIYIYLICVCINNDKI